jgi:large repetitive protein
MSLFWSPLRRSVERNRSVTALVETLEGRRLLSTGTAQTQLLINVDSPANRPLRTIVFTVHRVFANQAPITGTISGTIQINHGPVVDLGTKPVGADGTVTFFMSAPIPNGSDTNFTGAYSGDSIYAASSVPGFILVIPSVNTLTTVSATPNPALVGQSVTLTANVTADGQAFGTANDTVTFSIDGAVQMPVPITVVVGRGSASFSTPRLPAGSHVIVAAYNANSDSDPYGSSTSDPLIVNVRLTVPPPVVTSLQRFGYHRHPTTLVLGLSEPLDLASATNTANYQIVGPGGRHIAVAGATYNDGTQTVTLAPARLLNIHRTYILTVIATQPNGVHGVDGTPLDGSHTGEPGTNFVAPIDRTTLVAPEISLRRARAISRHAAQHMRFASRVASHH